MYSPQRCGESYMAYDIFKLVPQWRQQSGGVREMVKLIEREFSISNSYYHTTDLRCYKFLKCFVIVTETSAFAYHEVFSNWILFSMLLLLTMEHYSANDKIIFKISMDSSGNNIQQDFTIWCHFSFGVLWEKDSGREAGLRKNVFQKKNNKGKKNTFG